MNGKALIVIVIGAIVSCGCRQGQGTSNENPPAAGFNLANSDPAAVELADSVMVAMGGRANWENIKYLSWNIGSRRITWDKKGHRVRIESPGDSIVYLVDLKRDEVKVQYHGYVVTNSDSIRPLTKKATKIWHNDSYWLSMPFRLKDGGVTLRYLGEDTITGGRKANILELTFNDSGTKNPKYLVYVDVKDNLIKQWAYFENQDQDSASYVWPWDNYKRYGGVLLSADRSDGQGPKNLRVHDNLPDKIFTEF